MESYRIVDHTYDVVVVGAGSAGCALAARLDRRRARGSGDGGAAFFLARDLAFFARPRGITVAGLFCTEPERARRADASGRDGRQKRGGGALRAQACASREPSLLNARKHAR